MKQIALDETDLQTLNDCIVSAPIPYHRTSRLIQNINRQLQASVKDNEAAENNATYTHE